MREKISDKQWKLIEKFFPKSKSNTKIGGRPSYSNRDIFNGVLWVLRVGARWGDIPSPKGYPSGKTCHRHFSKWVELGIFDKILRVLLKDLESRGKIKLDETFVDATFVEAKKGAQKLVKPRPGRDLRLWQSWTIDLFLSPCLLRVLHHMRVDLLYRQFGPAIFGTNLTDLSETKLTILINLGKIYDEEILNSLVPISGIEKERLKMDELYDATDEDGWSSDFLPGFSSFDE